MNAFYVLLGWVIWLPAFQLLEARETLSQVRLALSGTVDRSLPRPSARMQAQPSKAVLKRGDAVVLEVELQAGGSHRVPIPPPPSDALIQIQWLTASAGHVEASSSETWIVSPYLNIPLHLQESLPPKDPIYSPFSFLSSFDCPTIEKILFSLIFSFDHKLFTLENIHLISYLVPCCPDGSLPALDHALSAGPWLEFFLPFLLRVMLVECLARAYSQS